MKVRIIKTSTGDVLSTATEDTYRDVAMLLATPNKLTGEEEAPYSLDELSIHPEDVPGLTDYLTKKEIDKRIKDAGITDRDLRVWSGNLAMLNVYLISKLIKVGEAQWADDIPDGISDMLPLADQVIGQVENGLAVTSLLGPSSIIAHALSFSQEAGDVLKSLAVAPVVPTLN